jgi:Domain of unknown function (DUF6089)
MKRFIQSVTLIVLLFIAGQPGASAQINFNKWQVGVSGGIFVYQGDLTPTDYGSYKTIKPVFSGHISRILNRSLLLRTNVAVGKLYGNDAKYSNPEWRQYRNYSFTTPVTEISELLVWNMKSNNGNELGLRFSPYAFAGLGVSFLNVKRDYSQFDERYFAGSTSIINGLNADMNATPPRSALVIPIGLGIEFYLTPKLSLTAETNFRYTANDYLDGFSLGANPESDDFYHSNTIGLIYRFGKGNNLGCPVIKQ